MSDYNYPLIRKVYEQITTDPETHDQSSFERERLGCGTTRCVAGWALHIRGYQIPSIVGVLGPLRDPDGNAILENIGFVAARELGLSDEEADGLFFFSDNDQAVRTLETILETEGK